MNEIIVGIDDVTRCPLIGSLICTGVAIEKWQIPYLTKMGVKDSKLLTYKQIHELAKLIMKIGEFKTHYIRATEISESKPEYNMNDMECKAYCMLAENFLEKYPEATIQLNNFDRSREKFIERAEKLGFHFNWDKWIIAHENESRDIAVGCASIIGKHFSLIEYDELRKQYGDFGSGNPNDPKVLEFVRQKLKENKKCDIIRYNWKTVKRLMSD